MTREQAIHRLTREPGYALVGAKRLGDGLECLGLLDFSGPQTVHELAVEAFAGSGIYYHEVKKLLDEAGLKIVRKRP